MSLIDNTYFVGEIAVPLTGKDAALEQAINQYEREILISLLGNELYRLLQSDLTGENGAPVTQKYINLVNGAEFKLTLQGYEYNLKWEGLKNTLKQSLIAYYVFYNYVKRDVTRLYGTGISMAETKEGFVRANPTNKLCAAWERMRELYGKIPPEFRPVYGNRPVVGSNLSGVFDAEPSAYNFLYANKTNYQEWIFTPLWNAFGI
jgi:hypothetical protein